VDSVSTRDAGQPDGSCGYPDRGPRPCRYLLPTCCSAEPVSGARTIARGSCRPGRMRLVRSATDFPRRSCRGWRGGAKRNPAEQQAQPTPAARTVSLGGRQAVNNQSPSQRPAGSASGTAVRGQAHSTPGVRGRSGTRLPPIAPAAGQPNDQRWPRRALSGRWAGMLSTTRSCPCPGCPP